ncbi:MAG: endonuclease/exonuclease/phosphatase family protein [Actinomycetota bacterium]|nr:endonuclease/exonuclease/phosphatase family protein [Actinomycetota bacterium]
MGEPRFTRRVDLSSLVLWSLTPVVLAESVRALFPILFDAREDSGAAVAVGIAIAVFGVGPMIGSALRRSVGTGRAVRISLGALVAGRLAMQLVRPIPVWLVALTVAIGLAALALELSSARTRDRAAAFAMALIAGLAVDAVIRGAFSTVEVVWQEELAAAVVTMLVSIALVIAAAVAPGRDGRPESPAMGPTWSVVLLGPFFLLEVLYLQNVAFVTSETGFGLVAGVSIVLIGNALGLAAVARAATGPTPWTRVLSATAAVMGTALLALVGGRSVQIVLPLTQAAAAVLLLLAVAARTDVIRTAWRADAAIALGMLLFVGATFGYLIDVDVPLPLPRSTWPIAAGVMLALASGASIDAMRLPRFPALIPALGAVLVPAALLATAPTLASAHGGATTIRLLDWNIHGAVNGDGQVDLSTIAGIIAAEDPDVVTLQEVGRGWPITGQADQALWLSRALGMHVAWASAADGQFGNAILTTAPPSNVRVVQLPYGEGPQQRSALSLTVSVDGDGRIQVIDTHLQNGDVPTTREQQIEAVLALSAGDANTVIAGDLNMQPTERNVAMFVGAGLISAQDGAGDPGESTARDPAFPGDRVDWIWTAGGISASSFTIVETDASDHLPLVVTLTATE